MKRTFAVVSFLIIALLAVTAVASETRQVFAFEEKEYTVLIGKTIKPKPIAQGIEGKLSYEWSSSAENIATVKSGTVTGLSNGCTVITCSATAKDGNTYTAECNVRVNIPIKTIEAEESSIEVALSPIGTSMFYHPGNDYEPRPYMYKPVITITPVDASNQTLEWVSANPSIASVSEDGIIFGESAGATTITGKATDGSGKKVQIKVKVPSCYVTEDNITITSEEGIKIGYIRGSSSGINSYNIVTTGKVATFEPLDEAGGMDWLRIIPLKAGQGTLSFLRNGKKMRTIKIKVEHSAVHDSVSYPAVKLSSLIASQAESIGKKTHFKCEIVDVVPDERLGMGGGIIYASFNENNKKQFAIFEHEHAKWYKPGDIQTIYGTVSKFVEYVTDTGLVYTCPYFIDSYIER